MTPSSEKTRSPALGGWDAARRYCAHSIVAVVIAILPAGCILQPELTAEKNAEFLVGKDSAGAIVEIEKIGNALTKARVTDAVLGEGEADVTRASDQLSFTVTFPVGVTITYSANVHDLGLWTDGVLYGLWIQQPGGMFGGDAGTWSVQLQPSADP